MTQATATPNGTRSTHQCIDRPAQTPIDHVLERLSGKELPSRDLFEAYLHHKWRLNHTGRSMSSSFGSIMLFLQFYAVSGKSDIRQIERADLEAFIEHEQDRGIRITTVKTRLSCIVAFLHFLMEQEIITTSVLKRRIRFKLPDTLPRAINPKDVKKLLSMIDQTRDRALFFLLLRTGIRIGEALALTMNDIDLKEKKVHIYEGEKNKMGRVVYLSNDAVFCLKRWFKWRDQGKTFIFYGRSDNPICYSTARSHFAKYLKDAELDHKGYTVHCLRHTYASELLNAGMRLEVLQQLLGHQDIEMTRRYARLTDRTREEEYFRAMALIEKGDLDGDY
jgi:integrase/recombinase XerD